MINLLILLSIPVLFSLSWILGERLVLVLSPLVLASSRALVATIVLSFFSTINAQLKSLTFSEKVNWWKNQLILSLTGRVIYYYFSTQSLLTISPQEATLILATLPVLVLMAERLTGKPFKSSLIPILTGLAAVAVITALMYGTNQDKTNFSWFIGHTYMAIAIFAFSVHLVFYKRRVKERTPTNTLFAQFAIATLLLLPIDINGYKNFPSLSYSDWVSFFLYAVICNLVPFIFVHHAIKRTSPILVAAFTILTPIFAIIVRTLQKSDSVSSRFISLSFTACSLILLAQVVDALSDKKLKANA